MMLVEGLTQQNIHLQVSSASPVLDCPFVTIMYYDTGRRHICCLIFLSASLWSSLTEIFFTESSLSVEHEPHDTRHKAKTLSDHVGITCILAFNCYLRGLALCSAQE